AAQQCLEVAASTFGVSFARAEAVQDDPEHGSRPRPAGLRPHALVAFYRGPLRVASIAREKLRGRLELHDGGAEADSSWDFDGSELAVRFRELLETAGAGPR